MLRLVLHLACCRSAISKLEPPDTSGESKLVRQYRVIRGALETLNSRVAVAQARGSSSIVVVLVVSTVSAVCAVTLLRRRSSALCCFAVAHMPRAGEIQDGVLTCYLAEVDAYIAGYSWWWCDLWFYS